MEFTTRNNNCLLFSISILCCLIQPTMSGTAPQNVLDNGVIGDPAVECMEDRVRLTFHTERPFTGRIFVKGMVENDKCVNNYVSNTKQAIDFQLINGQCNMRRSRKHRKNIPSSRAYRCTCFYMEADKVVTNRFDVSVLPTTELIDTAKMPLCTYTVRRGSVNGPVVTYATVGEPVFHVWSCDSDMFSMLVHNCFVDDGAGKDRKPLLDEHGCTIDPVIVSDLTYNNQANLAYSEVNVFKFADKITTYFQCAVSTCMVSEGMCTGKTPPRCGANSRKRRTINGKPLVTNNESKTEKFVHLSILPKDDYVMDLAAEKIVVLDLDDSTTSGSARNGEKSYFGNRNVNLNSERSHQRFLDSSLAMGSNTKRAAFVAAEGRVQQFHDYYLSERVCFSYYSVSLLTCIVAFSFMSALAVITIFLWRQRSARNPRKF